MITAEKNSLNDSSILSFPLRQEWELNFLRWRFCLSNMFFWRCDYLDPTGTPFLLGGSFADGNGRPSDFRSPR
jgi:hypothetical protein